MVAAVPRELAPAPQPLGLAPSFGFGDRLGNATPGHVRALEATRSGLAPVFAQQSARELDRTGRTWTDVLDAAAQGVWEAGWTERYGADADHLRTVEEVEAALAAGFTMFTLDPSSHVDLDAPGASGAELERRVRELPWEALEDDWAALRRRYAGTVGEVELARAIATWGAALAHVVALGRPLAGRAVDLEVSVDETPWPTSPDDLRVLVGELRRLGVRFTSLAPRFPGSWQKGVDVEIDPGALEGALAVHAALAADRGPYKLSIHSGSDKFSVYPVFAALSELPLHVKTSGTSYLEALRVVARVEPEAFRAVLAVARAGFERARAGYFLGDTAGVPDAAALGDDELPSLLDDPGTRQGLHVTFGGVWAEPELRERLRHVLEGARGAYHDGLATHLAAHLAPLAAA